MNQHQPPDGRPPCSRRTYLLLGTTLLFAAGYFRPAIDYDNSKSRYLLLTAAVDDGRLDIGTMSRLTIDISEHDGRYYSCKAIGAPLLAAPLYAGLRAIPFTRGEVRLDPLHRFAVNLAVSGASLAGLGLALFSLGRRWGAAPRAALSVALAVCLGSIAWVHATMFSGHLPAGVLPFLGFIVLGTGRGAEPARGSVPWACLAGLLIGLGALCDYVAMIAAAVLAVYAMHVLRGVPPRLAFLLAGAACAAILAAYNAYCFGGPFASSYAHVTLPHFAEGHRQGLLGISLPSVAALWGLIFSPSRGLFFQSPIFTFSLFGMAAMARERDRRPELWTCASIAALTFLANAGYYSWQGGWSWGPRHLVPMLPFLAAPMLFAPVRNRYFLAAAVASVAQTIPAITSFPYPPPEIANPLVELSGELIARGYWAQTPASHFGLPPLAGALMGLLGVGALAAMTFASAGSSGAALQAPPENQIVPEQKSLVVLQLALIGLLLAFVRTDEATRDFFRKVLVGHYGYRGEIEKRLGEIDRAGGPFANEHQ